MPFTCLPVSLALLLCYLFVPALSATLGNKTIELPLTQTCMAARMEYVGRNRDCARQRIDAVQHYERMGHAAGQIWRGDLCNVQPVYQTDPICQCDAAVRTYLSDNPTVRDAWEHYTAYLEDIHRTWHCEKCLGVREDMCLAARRDYRLRYLTNFTEPSYHYYTFGISLGYLWNSSKCYPANMSSVIYMDSPVINCRAAENWYNTLNPDSRNPAQGGEPTGYQHYMRYAMEYGAYWNATLCVDVENECALKKDNCSVDPSLNLVCNNLIGDYGSFECICAPGYYGSMQNCTDLNECVRNASICGRNATCSNSVGSYQCNCRPGFYKNGSSCFDFDECAANTYNCSAIQTCENTLGGYKCNCPIFYESNGAYGCDYQCPYPWKSCSVGHCVSVETDMCLAEPVCTFPSPYFCAATNSCVAAATSCVGNNTSLCAEKQTCWDGSCASSHDTCATLPECPPYLRRCQDGSCAKTCADTTCADPNQLCKDGLCARTCSVNWNGCPLRLPFLCSDGSCTSDVSTCVVGNFTVARIQRAQPMTIYFPVGSVGPSQTNITIPVSSETGAPIVTLVLSADYFENQVGLLAVEPLPDSKVYAAGIAVWGEDFEPSSKIHSGPVEVTINGSNGEIEKSIEVHFDISVVAHLNMSDLCIGIINETTNTWQCRGSLRLLTNNSVYGFTIPGKMAVIQYIPVAAPISSPRRQRTVGIYLFAGIVLIYSLCLIFAAVRDRKMFIEIVAETIKREGSVTAITGIPYQPAAVDEPAPTEQDRLEEKRREMAKRGVSMPNIILPDEVRAKHMSHTKHAVVISGDGRTLSTMPLQPEKYLSGAVTERTTRAMTFDSAYQPITNTTTSHRISFDPSIIAPAIPPYNPLRTRRRSGEVAASPVSFHLPPESTQRSFRLSKGSRTSRNMLYNNNNNSSSSISSGEEDLRGAHEMDDLSRSQDLVSIPSPTPLMPRLAAQEPPAANTHLHTQARKLEWEMSVRAMALKPEVKDLQRMSLWDLMKLKHTWLSMWFTKQTSRLTCVEQVTILFCMVLGNLSIGAPFFDGKTEYDISESIIVAAVASSLVFLVTIAITLLFQNMKRSSANLIVFAVTFVFSCFCIVLAMIYSYRFELAATKMWVTAFGIACAQDLLVNQPFKVLVIALLYGWFPADHWFVKLL